MTAAELKSEMERVWRETPCQSPSYFLGWNVGFGVPPVTFGVERASFGEVIKATSLGGRMIGFHRARLARRNGR